MLIAVFTLILGQVRMAIVHKINCNFCKSTSNTLFAPCAHRSQFQFAQIDLLIVRTGEYDRLFRMKGDLIHRTQMTRQLVDYSTVVGAPDVHETIGRAGAHVITVLAPAASQQVLFVVVRVSLQSLHQSIRRGVRSNVENGHWSEGGLRGLF